MDQDHFFVYEVHGMADSHFQMPGEKMVLFLERAGYERWTPIAKLDFTVFDTETTGFQVEKDDRLIEIGAVHVKGFEVQEQRQIQTYVNPNRHISQEITQLTSIGDSKVKNAPQAIEAISGFFDFVDKNNSVCFVGHYVAFDILVLKSELKRKKITFFVVIQTNPMCFL